MLLVGVVFVVGGILRNVKENFLLVGENTDIVDDLGPICGLAIDKPGNAFERSHSSFFFCSLDVETSNEGGCSVGDVLVVLLVLLEGFAPGISPLCGFLPELIGIFLAAEVALTKLALDALGCLAKALFTIVSCSAFAVVVNAARMFLFADGLRA